MKVVLVAVAWCLTTGLVLAQEKWTFGEPYIWTRDDHTGNFEKQGDGYVVHYSGKEDWSLSGFSRIAVEPGEMFDLSGNVKIVSDVAGADAETGVILRDGQGEVVSWNYGGQVAALPGAKTELKSHFMVPTGVSSIEPRMIGHGASSVFIEDYQIRRVGTVRDRMNPSRPKQVVIDGRDVKVILDGVSGGLTIRDTRTGRLWGREPGAVDGWLVLDAVVSPDKRQATLVMLNPETTREIRATFTVEKDAPEIQVEIASDGPLSNPLDFPSAFATRKGDRLIVPMNEGMGFPVDEEHSRLWRMIAYGGHGICMGFFGVAEDATGAGWMCILETPDDAAMAVRKGHDGLWQNGPSWDATMGQFGYARRARYVFFDQGGPVAMCKRYRRYAKQIGLFKPFTEKVKRNPKIDKLIGAANIWNFDAGPEKLRLVAEMQSLGMDRLLWSGAGSADELAAMNARTNVLTGRYDIYQDIMDPANFDKLSYRHSDWVTEAFPQNINWVGPNGKWRHGWEIEKKDGSGMIPCAVICDSQAVPYARKRMGEELKTKPYQARFIDTTVAAPWFECYHPDHLMTRTQSRQYKMELLRLVSETFNLVCGSETGHEAAVPFCDYFEGMLSIGNYRVEDAGRNMWRVLDDVPEQISKYQVGERYRLPLWELVYHDCVVAQWYWGDYNNKLPKVWRKRDLFNALYGTPPMYLFGLKQWDEMKASFAASYQVAEPVSRATGYSEMTDFRILTPDRSVQQTVFANGVTVTVNFGSEDYVTPDGTTIKPLDLHIVGIPGK